MFVELGYSLFEELVDILSGFSGLRRVIRAIEISDGDGTLTLPILDDIILILRARSLLNDISAATILVIAIGTLITLGADIAGLYEEVIPRRTHERCIVEQIFVI